MAHNKEDDSTQEMKSPSVPEHHVKEGLEEPKVKNYRPLQMGFVAFVLLVIILIVFGSYFDYFGTMD